MGQGQEQGSGQERLDTVREHGLGPGSWFQGDAKEEVITRAFQQSTLMLPAEECCIRRD